MDEYRSQCNLIAEHLEAGNTITAMEATGRPFYCYRLSARIHDLRHKRGMNIRTRQRRDQALRRVLPREGVDNEH